MRVLLIDVNYKNSSTGKIIYSLQECLNDMGNETLVCYGRGERTRDKNAIKFGYDIETYMHIVLTRLTGLTGCYSFFSTLKLLNCIKHFKPDVINLHEPHAYFLNPGMLFRYIKKKAIPLIYTFHCEFAYTGKCGYSYECSKWKNECGDCPHLRDYPKVLIFDFTRFMQKRKRKHLESMDDLIIVTPSKWLANRTKDSFLGDKTIYVINNGIDTKKIFYPRTNRTIRKEYNITSEKIVLAAAPYLMSNRKGGNWIIKLAKMMENESIQFIMIGVDQVIEEKPKNVLTLPLIKDQQRLAMFYSSADCFVLCSDNENFPTTPIESVCCGTPVVGFDVGGTAETVPSPLGLFCEYGDINSLCSNLRTVLGLKLVQEDFASIIAHYSNSRMAIEYHEIYNKILNTGGV